MGMTKRFTAIMITSWVFCLALGFFSQVWAQRPMPSRPLPQGVSISATVSTKDVVIGDRFSYTIKVNGSVTVERWEYPEFSQSKKLMLLEGPDSTSSFVSANGVSHQVVEHRFVIKSTDTGNVTIESARLLINGVWYESNSVELTISDIQNISKGISGVIFAKSKDDSVNKQLDGRYWGDVEVARTAWHGQAVPVTFYVYRDPQLPDFLQWQILQPASGSDFFVPDVLTKKNMNRQWKWQTIQVDGKTFERTKLFSSYVIPTRGGKLRLTPPMVGIRLPVQARQRSSFDSMFPGFSGSDSIRADLQVRLKEIEVKSSPSAPTGTIGEIVGGATVDVTVDQKELQHRELLTLKISVKGDGFFDLLSPPTLPDLENLSLVDTQTVSYPPEVIYDVLFSQRDFEYVYQAISPGELTIPSLKFGVFDPKKGLWQVEESPEMMVKVIADDTSTVQVAGTVGTVVSNGSIQAAQRARELGQDIEYIDIAPLTKEGVQIKGAFYLQPWFWGLQALPALFSLGVGGLAWRKRRFGGETAAMRTRRGRQAAANALREAQQSVEKAEREDFYTRLSQGVITYVASLLGKSAQGLTIEEAVHNLNEKGCSSESCRELEQILQSCDSIRYSPAIDNKETRQQALKSAENILRSLDKEEGEK